MRKKAVDKSSAACPALIATIDCIFVGWLIELNTEVARVSVFEG
jgi:hypothetical protein